MEALIGFAIGYWAGTQAGQDGVKKALEAFDAITRSEEFKSFTSQGLGLVGGLLSKGLESSGGGGFAQGVVGVVAERAGKLLGGGLRAA